MRFIKTSLTPARTEVNHIHEQMWQHAIGEITLDTMGNLADLPWANEAEKWVGDRIHGADFQHNPKKHGKDILVYDHELAMWMEGKEHKTLTELRKGRWVNSFTVNLWSGKHTQVGDEYCILALDLNFRLGYIIKGRLSQAGWIKLQQYYDKKVDRLSGEGQSSKYSLAFEFLDDLRVHYVNKEAVMRHFTDPRSGANKRIRQMLLDSDRELLAVNCPEW